MKCTQQSAIRDGPDIDDSTFSLLASARRRTVLRCLHTTDDAMGVADLARDVVARERDADASEHSEETIEQVQVSLHHRHLPKLEDEGYLRYTADRTAVELTDDADSLAPILDWAAQATE